MLEDLGGGKKKKEDYLNNIQFNSFFKDFKLQSKYALTCYTNT